jgi:hypothetical protein
MMVRFDTVDRVDWPVAAVSAFQPQTARVPTAVGSLNEAAGPISPSSSRSLTPSSELAPAGSQLLTGGEEIYKSYRVTRCGNEPQRISRKTRAEQLSR